MNFNREVENSNNIILSFVSFDLDGNILDKFEKNILNDVLVVWDVLVFCN